MTAAEPALLRVERPLPGVAVVTLSRPDAMNAFAARRVAVQARGRRFALADPAADRPAR